MKLKSFHSCWLFLLLYKITGSESLKNVKIIADPAIRVGDSLRLECDYDLENALLYSIKWYFGTDEFYRFVPKESPPTRVFPMPGVYVDLSKSNSRVVIIENVQRDRTGFYGCEVSADAPSFHTEIRKTLVIVVEVPAEPPAVFAIKKRNDHNELISIEALCTSSNSYPAVNLTWFINGVQVQDDAFKTINTTVANETNSLESTQSVMKINTPSATGVFVEGKLFLTCEATQFSVYKDSTNYTVTDDSPSVSSVVGQTPLPASCNGISSKIIVIMTSSLMALLLDR